MMNDEMEQFENRLRQQPLKKIPADWRAEILSAAHVTRHTSLVTRRSRLSTINSKLSTFFWPHPKAWAALATVWILILGLQFAVRDTSPGVVEKISPPSPEVMAELKQQQKLYAELIGANETHDADRPKNLPLRPRTQRVEVLAA